MGTHRLCRMPPVSERQKLCEAGPTKAPNLSPITEVRVKWRLNTMDVGELRKRVLGGEKKEKEEKEWLINILMGKEADINVEDVGEDGEVLQTIINAKIKKEECENAKTGGGGGAGKRGRAGAVDRDKGAVKRPKTVG